jgi:hypothetical protein
MIGALSCKSPLLGSDITRDLLLVSGLASMGLIPGVEPAFSFIISVRLKGLDASPIRVTASSHVSSTSLMSSAPLKTDKS